MYQTNSYARFISYILKCRTLCKSTEVNWLKIGDIVRVSKIDHQFFSLRPGTDSTGCLKRTFVNMGMQDLIALVVELAKIKCCHIYDLISYGVGPKEHQRSAIIQSKSVPNNICESALFCCGSGPKDLKRCVFLFHDINPKGRHGSALLFRSKNHEYAWNP